MNNEQKASLYGQLLNEHTRLHNQINEIKGQNIDPKPADLKKIQELERRQVMIMRDINRLMS